MKDEMNRFVLEAAIDKISLLYGGWKSIGAKSVHLIQYFVKQNFFGESVWFYFI